MNGIYCVRRQVCSRIKRLQLCFTKSESSANKLTQIAQTYSTKTYKAPTALCATIFYPSSLSSLITDDPHRRMLSVVMSVSPVVIKSVLDTRSRVHCAITGPCPVRTGKQSAGRTAKGAELTRVRKEYSHHWVHEFCPHGPHHQNSRDR